MTRLPANLPPEEQEFETVVRDAEGRELLRNRMTIRTETAPDGTIRETRKSDLEETGDGFAWSAAMLRQNPPVLLASCAICRRRKRAKGVMSTLAGIKRCVHCERNCCPRHRRRGADGQWRCLRHHRWYRLGRLAHRILFVSR